EVALPEAVADDDYRAAARAIFFGEEGAANDGFDAKERENAGGHVLRVEALGLAGAGESDARGASGFDGFEGMALVAPVDPILVGGRDSGVGTFFGDEDEAGRIAERERTEEDGVDDGQDGRVRADAEGEREDGDGGEAGAFCEEAEGVTDILYQSEHGFPRGANLPHPSDGRYEQSLPSLVGYAGEANVSVRGCSFWPVR